MEKGFGYSVCLKSELLRVDEALQRKGCDFWHAMYALLFVTLDGRLITSLLSLDRFTCV